ncbi:MAG: efflux RND transporter permease subunit [Bacteroidales bacterium]|nr:efflux RND transporter permease subunit [Bacteroidales bacterium]
MKHLSPFAIIIIFAGLSLIGLSLLSLLPLKLQPDENLPGVSVSFSMRGAASKVVETEVTSVLEAAFAKMRGVKGIYSSSSNGGGYLSVSLDKHADIEAARFEISSTVRQIWPQLPEGVSYPHISVQSSCEDSGRPFMTFTVNAEADLNEIDVNARKIFAAGFSDIQGIKSVDIYGAKTMERQLVYDASVIQRAGISSDQIRKIISEYRIKKNIGKYMLTDGIPDSIFSLEGLFAETSDTVLIGLQEILKAGYQSREAEHVMRINGLNSVYLDFTAESSANQLTLKKQIEEKLLKLKTKLPQGYQLHKTYDATEYISEELNKIYYRSALTVAILLVFVFLTTFSAKRTLVVVCSLFCNLAVAFAAYYLLKVELQLYSLAGITISLNLMIDNTIIMSDHWLREKNLKAVLPVTAATLTTVGALSIVFFLDEKLRLNLYDFAVVMIVNLVLSVFTSLFLVPSMLKMSKNENDGKPHFRRLRIAAKFSRIYSAVAKFCIKRKIIVLTVMVLGFGFSLWVFVDKVYSGSYWRDNGETVLHINASLPYGAKISQMDFLIREMEVFLSGFKEVRLFKSDFSSTQGSIEVHFTKTAAKSAFPYTLKSAVISKGLQLGGGSWSVYGLQDQGFSNDVSEQNGSYVIKMSGYNYQKLNDFADSVKNYLLQNKRVKEVNVNARPTYFKSDYSEFHLKPKQEVMIRQNISAYYLFYVLRQVFISQYKCGFVQNGSRQDDIVLYTSQSEEYDVWSLLNRPVTLNGREYKIGEVCTLEKCQSPQEIVKQNQEYQLCLQYEYIGSSVMGDKVSQAADSVFSSKLPAGFSIKYDRLNYFWGKEDGSQYLLLLIIVGIIFFVTAVLFNSLKLPAVILGIIPSSYAGLFLTFYVFSLNFDQGGFAAMVLLCGITVNASIYIVNEYQCQRRKKSDFQAFVKALNIKIVPVFLTVLSTVLGFIPFMIGEKEAFWFPLAAGTTGGLVMSVLGVFLFLPAMTVKKKHCKKYLYFFF